MQAALVIGLAAISLGGVLWAAVAALVTYLLCLLLQYLGLPIPQPVVAVLVVLVFLLALFGPAY